MKATKHPNWQSFVSLTWYDGVISFLFQFVAKTAEPLLAAGVIVSAADFLQKGQLMAHNAMLAGAWSWTQSIAIEASTGPVLVFALQAFKAEDKVKGWLYAVLAFLLFVVGGAMLLLQLMSNATGLNETTINPVILYGLFVLRVIVASGVIALACTKQMRFSGMLKDEPVQAPQVQIPDVTSIADEIKGQLGHFLEKRIQAEFQQVKVTIEQSMSQELPAIHMPAQQALPAPTQISPLLSAVTGSERFSFDAVPAVSIAAPVWLEQPLSEFITPLLPPVENDEPSLSVNTVNAFQENAGKGKIESKRDAVARARANNPDALLPEIAQIARCSEKTAQKWWNG